METKKLSEFMDKIRQILAVCGTRKGYNLGAIQRLVYRMNPEFPGDSADLLDMARIARDGAGIPTPEDLNKLEALFSRAGEFYGKVKWSYNHPHLTLTYTPGRDGYRIQVRFTPPRTSIFDPDYKSAALTFPLSICFDKYADPYTKEGHCEDICPVYYPDHTDDCPVTKWHENGGTQEELDAEEDCECGSTECDCEPPMVWRGERTFESPTEFWSEVVVWMTEQLWA